MKSILSKLFFGTIFLTLGLIIAIIVQPKIIVNETSINYVMPYVNSDKFSLKWQGLDFDVKSDSILEKTISTDLTNVCLKTEEINACFDKLKFTTSIKLGKPIEIISVGPAEIIAREVKVVVKPQQKAKKSQFNIRDWVYFNEVSLRKLNVLVDYWSVKVKEDIFEGTASLNSGTDSVPWRMAINLIPNDTIDKANLNLELKNFTVNNSIPWTGEFNLDFKLKKTPVSGIISAELTQKEVLKKDFDYKLDGTIKLKKRQLKGSILGDLVGDKFRAEVTTKINTGLEVIPNMQLKKCELLINQIFNKTSSQYQLQCGLLADVVLPIPNDFPDIELPKSTGADFKINLDAKFPPSMNDPVKGDIFVKLQPILTPLFSGGGQLTTKIQGLLKSFPTNLTANADLDLNVTLPSFQMLVDKMEGSSWSVPAPFNQLKGKVELGLKGESNLDSGLFPFFLNTRLSSQYQNLDVDSSGKLFINLAKFLNPTSTNASAQHKLDLDVQLSNIQLALPRLNLEAPPRLFSDTRIGKSYQAKDLAPKKELPIDYNINIKTADQPIRILSNLAKAPVPISVDTKIVKGQPLYANIGIGNFPVEIFNRKANLESLNITLKGGNAPVLNGEVSIDYTDYSIMVYLLGTTEKPIVKIESDPPLSQDEVISVLLYGRTLEELDTDQQESVGNTKSALTDRSLGIASLYLLASTPIESVGYNPDTQEVSAKVKLAKGTSLNLGSSSASGASSNRVGIRRRLSKHFTISTDYTRETGTDAAGSESATSTVETLIEWSKRY